jgi:plastocyanin
VNSPSKRVRILGIVLGLLCAVTAAVWIVRGSGASSPVDKPGLGQPAPAEQASPSAKDARQVDIDNFKFEPRRLTVAAGTRVTWVNRDDVPHTATSMARPKAFDSKTLDTDGQFSHVFTTPGTYEYFCAVHPHMRGEVVVK